VEIKLGKEQNRNTKYTSVKSKSKFRSLGICINIWFDFLMAGSAEITINTDVRYSAEYKK
jgi:hypothetical protein